MAYEIITDPVAQAGIEALPPDVRPVLDEVMTVIGMVPWRADPINADNPDGEVRQAVFAGEGMVTYLIVDHDQEVHVLAVQWLG